WRPKRTCREERRTSESDPTRTSAACFAVMHNTSLFDDVVSCAPAGGRPCDGGISSSFSSARRQFGRSGRGRSKQTGCGGSACYPGFHKAIRLDNHSLRLSGSSSRRWGGSKVAIFHSRSGGQLRTPNG